MKPALRKTHRKIWIVLGLALPIALAALFIMGQHSQIPPVAEQLSPSNGRNAAEPNEAAGGATGSTQ